MTLFASEKEEEDLKKAIRLSEEEAFEKQKKERLKRDILESENERNLFGSSSSNR